MTIPNSVTSIGEYAFAETGLTQVVIPNPNCVIADGAFGSGVVINYVPVADAGSPQTVDEGTTVTLDGSGSSDADTDTLTYSWTASTDIVFTNTTVAKPTFMAPVVTQDTDYIISLVVTDGTVNSVQSQVTITVNDVPPVNSTPTVLALDANSIAENEAVTSVVGTFSTVDSDANDAHTYTLVSGTGDTDNGNFTITGSSLKTAASFDYETQTSYSILVQADDGNGGTLKHTFTITITDDASDNPQVVSYGWEDTGVHLGKSGNLKSAFNVGAENGVNPHEGTSMLKLTGAAISGNAPEAYLVWVTGLTEGDQVKVSYWVSGLNTDGSKPAGRIWGGYTNSGQISSDENGSAGGSNTYGGDDAVWEQLNKTWTVSSGEVALNVKVRLYDDAAGNETIYVDDVQITVSNPSAIINMPQPDTTAPGVPTLTGPSLTNSQTPTLSGTAEAGSTVHVSSESGEKAEPIVISTSDAGLAIPTPPQGLKFGFGSSDYVLQAGDVTYWIYSYSDNRNAMEIVAYNSEGEVLDQATGQGARYFNFEGAGEGSIQIDEVAQTVSFVGQDNKSVTFSYVEGPTALPRFNWLGQATAGASSGSYTLTVPALLEGSHSITATATDAAGNQSAASTILMVVVDTTPPVITLNGSPSVALLFGGAYTEENATSDGEETVTISGTVDVNTAGVYTLTYSASDAVGNAAAGVIRTVTVAANNSPTISDVTNQQTDEDTATGALAVTLGDADGGNLTLSASSSAPGLVPNENIVLGGSGANRTVTVTPADNQSGSATITLTVSDGTASTTDEFVLTVDAVNDAPTGIVTISGTVREDEVLTASNGLADVDGLGEITYQWKRSGSTIVGATSTNYTLVQSDVGNAITVTAIYTDGEGTVETVASAATGSAANVDDDPSGSVTINGTPTVGQTLTVSNSLADEDGLGTITYQWKADGSITAWGDGDWGGSGAPTDSGYTQVFSTSFAFAALKVDGTITAWGSSGNGGSGAPTDSGYTQVFSIDHAFAALKADGSITAWGYADLGGSGAPTNSGYTQIFTMFTPSQR